MQISANDWQKYVSKLSAINTKAGELLQTYIDKHGLNDIESVITYAHALVTKYGEAGSELACQMYDALAEAQGAYVNPAEPATIANRHEVAGAILKTHGTGNMIPAIERLVKTAASDTMLKNAKRDNAEWAWVSHGDTCAFCMHLSSLGWMPASKAILRGEHAEHIHANCDCEFAIRFDGKSNVEGYDPHKFKLIYDSADGKTSLDKLNAIRRQMYPLIKEERNAKRRELYGARKILNPLDNPFKDPNTKLEISIQKQRKHIPGTIEYENYKREFEKVGQYGPSFLYINEDECRELVKNYHGKGFVSTDLYGKIIPEELIVSNDIVIGEAVNNINGNTAPTTNFKIHYSKGGTHISPDYPSKKGKRGR